MAGCDSPGPAACEITSVGAWPAELSWREVWRVGGLDETERLVLPADLAAGPDGSVAIADWGLAEVIVLDRDGEWQGAVMTRGEGPG